MPPKVLLQIYPTLGGPEEMKKRRPIGRDNRAYQNMLADLLAVTKAADRLGYWGITHVEHHFHSEGLEISPHPGLLNLYLGQHTERIRHGQMGYTVPSHDPIRLAEEIAVLDHMLQGRFFVGMARGYQARWQNTLAQKFNAPVAAVGDPDKQEQDEINRQIFLDNYEIMKKAWTQETIQHDSEYYKIPGGNGQTPWPPEETTRAFGAPGELDDEGRIRRVCVVPKPYTDPHPRLFQAFSVSEDTLRWCGTEGIVPTILWGPLPKVVELQNIYKQAADQAGHNYEFGENTCLVRTVHFADSRSDLIQKIEQVEYPVWKSWYQPFRFTEALRFPDEDGPVPKPGEPLAERMIEAGELIGGTPERVRRDLSGQLETTNSEYLMLLLHLGIMSREESIELLEIFADEVLPHLNGTSGVESSSKPSQSPT